jgi:hypothetical protein
MGGYDPQFWGGIGILNLELSPERWHGGYDGTVCSLFKKRVMGKGLGSCRTTHIDLYQIFRFEFHYHDRAMVQNRLE